MSADDGTGVPAGLELLVVGGEAVAPLTAGLAAAGHHPLRAADLAEARAALAGAVPAALFLEAGAVDLAEDGPVPGLARLCPVIVVDPAPGVEGALAALRAGAADYLPCGAPPELAARALARIGAVHRLQADLDFWRDRAGQAAHGLSIGESPAMAELTRTIGLVAAADAPVLIRGEGGTGKSAVAQAIHDASRRAGQRLVTVDCAAELSATELFGAEAGGLPTGGILAQAQGGTLLLNDVERLPEAAVPHLLRLLETGSFRRVGGVRPVPFDARILATTSVDLAARAREGAFRDELYYRLATLVVTVPALRERRADIVPVARDLLARRGFRREVEKHFTPAALAALEAYDWPGNLRELHNAVDRGVIMSGAEPAITPAHLGLPARAPAAAAGRGVTLQFDTLPTADALRQAYVEHLLARFGGHRQKVAEVLGISERTTYRMLKREAEGGGGQGAR